MSLSLSDGIQEALVAILLFDPVGCKQAAGLVPPGAYDVHYRELAKDAIEYLEKYTKPAGDHTLDLVESLKTRRPDSAGIYQRIYESLLATKDTINREYVFAQAGKFAKGQRIRDGVSRAVDSLEKDDAQGVDEAEQALRKCLEGAADVTDYGGRLSDIERVLQFMTHPRQSFPTSIPALDMAGLGPARKELHILASDTGVGKTWWLLHLARTALKSRLRVLYVTLELSEQEIWKRLSMGFFAYTKRKGEVNRRRILVDDNGRFSKWRVDTMNRPYLFGNEHHVDSMVARLRRKLKIYAKRPTLVVKEFPAGTLTIRELKGFLAGLEGAGVMPDLILLDYPDEMEHDPKNKRIELIKIFTDLRGIAQERNVAVATVTQLNEQGAKARTATKSHLAEARGKAHKADVLLTVSQSAAEHDRDLARIFVAKGRADRDRFTILISQCLDLGQFVVDSARMSDAYEKLMPKKKEEKDGNG